MESGDYLTRVCVSDFGVSKLSENGDILHETNCGTPSYWAPENFTGRYNAAIDGNSVSMTYISLGIWSCCLRAALHGGYFHFEFGRDYEHSSSNQVRKAE